MSRILTSYADIDSPSTHAQPRTSLSVVGEKNLKRKRSSSAERPATQIPELKMEDLSCSEEEEVVDYEEEINTIEVVTSEGINIEAVEWHDDAFLRVWNAAVDDWKVANNLLDPNSTSRRTSDLWNLPSFSQDETALEQTQPTAPSIPVQNPSSATTTTVVQSSVSSEEHDKPNASFVPPHPIQSLPSALQTLSTCPELSSTVHDALQAWYDAGYKAGRLHARLEEMGKYDGSA
ncbi:hypothetical protein BT69DRAFT_1282406 [Atractiella rhizophila]|nr:hypothetical protein BT69DRAFT_1282406 [Atractiella rhizophila]